MVARKARRQMGARCKLAAPCSITMVKRISMQHSVAIRLPFRNKAAAIAKVIARFGAVLDRAPFTGSVSVN